MVGCGKLGLAVALAIESKGHEVKGYDINPNVERYLKLKSLPSRENGAKELLANSKMKMVGLTELCQWADILFLAPQTPHEKEFEGITRLPEFREDFDYRFLISCVQDVDAELTSPKTCVVISTVLPGTMEREIIPLLSENFHLIYEPLFIAMGTAIEDFLNPEFILCGTKHEDAYRQLADFYRGQVILRTDIRTAEGIKVLYNTFITAKTVLANLYGEMAHKLRMNVDDIHKAISLSTDRLLSPKYLRAGMGDGGGCHPRDNIALSYVARKIGLSFDFFEALMTAREKHCEFLADIIGENTQMIWILGEEFKPETTITTGSPSILLSNILKERGIEARFTEKADHAGTYFIGCRHERYKNLRFMPGSVVIDPFRYIQDQPGVKLISIGASQSEMVDSHCDTAQQGEVSKAAS